MHVLFCFFNQGLWLLILESLHSELIILKVEGVSVSKQLQISFLGKSSYVLFCLSVFSVF